MKQTIKEGKAIITIFSDKKISKDLPVFYNPVMQVNRDLSVLLLKALKDKRRIALPLAGSGVRGIRFLREAKAQVESVHLNDQNKEAIKLIKANLKNNKLPLKSVTLSQEDANLFLYQSQGFDYIDIDPFGPPIPFLDAAISRLSRKGILAITATDTGALSGTYPKACKRKYWSMPKKDSNKHETGLRILIRRVQLSGSVYDKALTPMLSYSKDHYMRVFFACTKGKEAVDTIFKQHQSWNEAGPLWTGELNDNTLLKNMIAIADENTKPFLQLLKEESKINQVGFYHIHDICKQHKWQVPNFTPLIEKIKKKKHNVSRTHFSPLGIKSTISEKALLTLLSGMQ